MDLADSVLLSRSGLTRLVDRLVKIALERHADRHRLDAGIKDFLAELALST